MLRLIPGFLKISTFFVFLCFHLIFPSASAQIEELTAPWRLETAGELDISRQIQPYDDSTLIAKLQRLFGLTAETATAIVAEFRRSAEMNDLFDRLNISNADAESLIVVLPQIERALTENVYKTRYVTRYQQDIPPRSVSVTKSPYRWGQKVTVSNSRGVFFGASFEKDPGEQFVYDHTAASLELPIPDFARVILGNYLVNIGQGLVINTQRNFGLGGSESGILRLPAKCIRPYAAWDENISLSGAAADLKIDAVDLCIWGSQRARDARLNADGTVTSFDDSGLHRTASETAHQNACWEEVIGTSLGVKNILSDFAFKTVINSVNWDHPVLLEGVPVTSSWAGSFMVRYQKHPHTISLESAWDHRGHPAQMGSAQLRFTSLRVGLAFYHIDPDYTAPLATVLDFDIGDVRNRTGLYCSLYVPLRRNAISGFAHLYRYPRRLPGQDWGGQDIGFLARRFWSSRISSSLASRWTLESEETDDANTVERWRGSLKLDYHPATEWSLRSSLYLTRSQRTSSWGKLLKVQLSYFRDFIAVWSLNSNFSAGWYNAADYYLRLYWYEFDFSRSLRVVPLWDQGIVFQLGTVLENARWGGVGLQLFSDNPFSTLDRAASQTITVLYRYHW